MGRVSLAVLTLSQKQLHRVRTPKNKPDRATSPISTFANPLITAGWEPRQEHTTGQDLTISPTTGSAGVP